MLKIRSKIVKTVNFLRGFLPAKLPVGIPEFEAFAKNIFVTYDLPDMPSYRQAMASMIMHLPPTTLYKPNYYFAKSVKKAMANQTAYEVIDQLREAQKSKQIEAATPKEDQPSANEPIPN